MRLFRILSLLAMLALAGCATVSAPTPQQQAQSQQADELYRQGQFEQAAQAYLNLAAQNRGGRDYFRLRAAEAWREGGALAQAAQALQGVERERLQPRDAQHYDLLRAEVALGQGDTATALRLTAGPVAALPAALQLRALELRARAQEQSGDLWAAAHTRITMDPRLSGMDQAQNRQQALELLTRLGAPALQQRNATLAAADPMRRWLAEALNQLGVAVAQPPLALDHPVGTVMPGATQAEGYRQPRQVALLLPTSGSLATAGNAVREGFFTAYFDHPATAGERPPVRVYDSGGTPQTSVAAYLQAVADGASLVIGPLTRDGVAAVLGQAQLPVPVLALNHPDSNQLPPPHATEFALRPETEGAQAAEHMRERGLQQALVLVSSEDFASRAARAFHAQFQAQGGQVVSTLTLDPGAVNYAAQIRALDSQALTNAGIFISMRPTQARLLLPQLRLAGLQLPVFGTSHIYAGSDNPVADEDLDGVEFCDAPWMFDAQPGLPSRAAIAARLPAARGTSGRLFAFGMDAWTLAPYLGWLRSHPGSYVAGASGQLAADAFGRVRRELIWARFENGVARPLAGNLELGVPTTQPSAVPAQAPPPIPRTLPAAAASTAPTNSW